VTVFGSHLLGGGLTIVSIKACDTAVELVSADYNIIISVANHFSAMVACKINFISNSGAVNTGASWSYITVAGQFGILVTITGKLMFGGAENVSTVSLAGIMAVI
jgi:hypothetical protein